MALLKEKKKKAKAKEEAPAKKRRREKKEAAEAEAEEEAPEDEDKAAAEEKRKDAQRQIQVLVKKMRDEGKSEKKISEAKRALKKKLGIKNFGKKAMRNQEWLQSEEREEQRKFNLDRHHDLVVIPVVWRSRHDANDVWSIAQDIKDLLMQQGVDAWVDRRRKYTPGQKFAYWEYRGVMLRIEIGPDDLDNGVCRICLAKTPGDYQSVQRRKVRLPPAGTREMLLALKDLGVSKLEIERRPGEEDDEEEVAPRAAKAKAAPEAPRGDDDVEGNWAGPPPKEPKQKKSNYGKKRKVIS